MTAGWEVKGWDRRKERTPAILVTPADTPTVLISAPELEAEAAPLTAAFSAALRKPDQKDFIKFLVIRIYVAKVRNVGGKDNRGRL